MYKRIIHLVLNEYFLLSFILLVGLILRFYKINSPIADWHSWRQADTSSVSRIYVEKGINFLYPKYYDVSSIQSGITNLAALRFVEFPLYNALHATAAKTFPAISLEILGRLLSSVFSLISTIFIFLIGRRFLDKSGGIISAFFFTFLPYNIYFSRVILPEPMAVTLALISVWLFIKFIDTEKDFYLFFSALWFSLSLLIKPFTIFYLLPLFYLLIDKYKFSVFLKNGRLLIKLALSLAIIVIPFFLWRIWENLYPQGIPFFEWAFNGDGIRFRPAFFRWIFGERIGRMILGIWGIFPFLAGIVSKGKKYFVQIFFLSQVLYISLIATANVRHDYYQILIIPSMVLILAQGYIFLMRSKKINQWLLKPILVFSTILMLGLSFYQIKDFYQINHPEIIAAGSAVNRLTSKDALVIAPYNGDTAFLYQTGRFGWPAVDDSFDDLIKKGADYYVSVNLNDADTKYILEKYEVVEKTPDYIIADLHKPL